MDQCPLCHIALVRAEYEGTTVHHCAQCHGYLLPQWKLESIQRNTSTSVQQLKKEATTEFRGDTNKRLKCPRCFFLMYKQDLPIPFLSLQLEVCERCELVWLDGGELALLQIVYEASEWHQDARELQRRMLEVHCSPERLARLEQAINNATGPGSLAKEALEQALDGLILLILRRGK